MLFGLGVLGGLPWFNGGLNFGGIDLNGHIGDLPDANKPMIIDGIEYPKDSISVTQTTFNST